MTTPQMGSTPREMNTSMAERLESSPAAPLQEGGNALRVLRTTGRKTGEQRATPVGLLLLDGEHYLVSPERGRDWVRNLLAYPDCQLAAGGRSDSYTAQPIAGTDACAVVRGYLAAVEVPWALRAFPVEKSATVQQIEKEIDQMAVFQLHLQT